MYVCMCLCVYCVTWSWVPLVLPQAQLPLWQCHWPCLALQPALAQWLQAVQRTVPPAHWHGQWQ